MSWLTYMESAIFQTPDAGTGPNVDFSTGDVDPTEYPDFHEHMVQEGWDNLDAGGREAAVDRYVGGVVHGVAARHQAAYGTPDAEYMHMAGWGYSEKEIEAKFGRRQEQREPRRALIPRLIHALLPF